MCRSGRVQSGLCLPSRVRVQLSNNGRVRVGSASGPGSTFKAFLGSTRVRVLLSNKIRVRVGSAQHIYGSPRVRVWIFGPVKTSTVRDLLGKNVSKEVCFWLWGKDNLVQLPKRMQRYVNWMQFVFPGQQWSFTSVFVDERFINKAQFNTGFAHRYKRSRSWFRTADGKWNGIRCLCFVSRSRNCSSLFSSTHGVPPGANRVWLQTCTCTLRLARSDLHSQTLALPRVTSLAAFFICYLF